MQSDIKPRCCTAKRQFAKGEQRNIIDFLKASITTDSIKIFSITFCTLVTVYCTCKIAKDAFRIVLYVTTFYMQHMYCAVACFVLRANAVDLHHSKPPISLVPFNLHFHCFQG